ncbi:MAG: glycosyltransferase family 4 protein, partial [Nitrososphaerota archaeon]|nr:glycosyltransferase family 4 protein [Nitrososphaerota archaeon]
MAESIADHGGGAERQARMLIAHLAKSHDVCVITRKSGSADMPRSYRLVNVRNELGIPHLPFTILATKVLVSELHRETFDVVHIFGNYLSAPLALVARLARVPLIVQSIAGMEVARLRHPILGMPVWCSLKFTHVIIAPNKYQSVILAHKIGNPVVYIPNGIDVVQARASPSDSCVTFCTVSTLSKWKRVDLLIEAADLLHSDKCDFRLLIIGDGRERRRLQQMISAHGLESTVTLLGYMSHSDVLRLLGRADCYVSASKSEGYGLSIAEAVSCGKPIIASYYAGIEELVENDENGLITADPHTLAGLMKSIAENRNLLKRLSLGSVKFSRRLKTWEEVGSEYERLYSTYL